MKKKEKRLLQQASQQALIDIAKYLNENREVDEAYKVSATSLNNKLNRYLNRLLGLHKVNKGKK